MMVEGWLGRNDPTGAWQYPPPPTCPPRTLDWDTWQGTVPKRPFDPNLFARWRCWKEYGTGVAGDLLFHLISGMMFMLGINEPPKQASAVGGIRRWKDGRNMPDVHAVVYYFGELPAYMRLNLGTEMPETYRIQGSKGILEVTGSTLNLAPQNGKDNYPSYYTGSYPHAMREAYLEKWHQENDPKLGQATAMPETISFTGPELRRVKPHLWTYFEAVRTRKPGSRTWCSVTTRHWPATWRMSRTSGGARCPGTRRRRPSRAELRLASGPIAGTAPATRPSDG